jgi:hypothetical protein
VTENQTEETEPVHVDVWIALPLRRYLPISHGWLSSPEAGVVDGSAPRFALPYRLQVLHVPSTPSSVRDMRWHGIAHAAISRHVQMADLADPARKLDESRGGPVIEGLQESIAVFAMPVLAEHEGLSSQDLICTIFDDVLEAANTLLLAAAMAGRDQMQQMARLRSEDIAEPVPVYFVETPAQGGPSRCTGVSWLVPRGGVVRTSSLIIRDPIPDSELRDALVDLSHAPPFLAYADARRDAVDLLHRRGDRRMSAVALGLAFELLTNTLLQHLLWEEQADPYTADTLFDGELKSRVLRHFASRLGGEWRENEGNRCCPVGGALERVVYLRNRVAHGGEVPHFQEVSLAIDALHSFERFIGDRLAADDVRTRYPRTAIAWSGQAGLERRGKLTKTLRRLSKSMFEPDWRRAFGVWTFHLLVARGVHPKPPTGNYQVIAEYPSSTSDPPRFILVDVSAQHAQLIEESDLEPGPWQHYMAHLEFQRRAEIDPMWRGPLRVDLRVDPPEPRGTWKPNYEFFPDLDYRLPRAE